MTPADIDDVGLRGWEADQVRGMGLDYKTALVTTFAKSDEAFAVEKDGELMLLFGHAARSLFKGSGWAWMLATPEAETHWRTMTKFSRKIVGLLSSLYPELYVATYTGNETAIRWLEWHGFVKHSSHGNTLTMVKH